MEEPIIGHTEPPKRPFIFLSYYLAIKNNNILRLIFKFF